MQDNNNAPLYERLIQHIERRPLSFHVPGHKFGEVFSEKGYDIFQGILSIDATEVPGLDDLHAAAEIIKESQDLAARFFGSEETYFLVNGSTAGNMASILAACRPGDTVLVQRNCHKSVLHGLELAGVDPVFFTPEFEDHTSRYSFLHKNVIIEALELHPRASAVILTYPDYFGRAYPIKEVIDAVHQYDVPVIVDEAHGVHFSLGDPFPPSSVHAGADLVVQSAHKMAPALTMSSYLHISGERVNRARLSYYLQMLQSSSPSYPLMASLDLARLFLSTFEEKDKESLLSYLGKMREVIAGAEAPYRVLPVDLFDDPLKITLEAQKGYTGFDIAAKLESVGIYVELADTKQVLLIAGLSHSIELGRLKKRLSEVNWQLKSPDDHGTMKRELLSIPKVQSLALSYQDMQQETPEFVNWSQAAGRICAEAVIPYPPGIPFILKGERLTEQQIHYVQSLHEQGASFQNTDIKQGTWVF
ncbi:aminotransferase class I/II-fold pyridoxal phosphate-dependent enzyme [Halobacillus sp. A5]|uniref:aminotransferase class I/II-fold pyridoxal phosphate-dependent enzyme n=1 Tax=Halobacillus sp. A5 TaxID=2880263 RepID=UPI0020A63EC5|nr:aminotransferase class I/II-fold pyridoxal phosphate-dependent enzyme [Halobacillus sp. A5]MCP3029719.1 aminotransferase class I/II-fold pyridoxal phosphate-dependent enzyme [Halobacillus sp. A5]